MNIKSNENNYSLECESLDNLLNEMRTRVLAAQKEAALANQSASFSPINELGSRIRNERKKQGLTQTDLSELSGVAYVTLNKIEQGHPSARLDSIANITQALGLSLWVG